MNLHLTFSRLLMLFCFAGAGMFSAAVEAQDLSHDPETTGKSPREVSIPWRSLHAPKVYWLEPTVGLNSGHWHTGSVDGDSNTRSQSQWQGLELGAKLLTDSNLAHTFLLGFDLRENIAWDSALLTDLRFGVHAEFRPSRVGCCEDLRWVENSSGSQHRFRKLANWLPDLGVSWFFGDLFRPTSRALEFSGTSWALSVSKKLDRMRWGIEYGWGDGAEGAGFVDQGHPVLHTVTWERLGLFTSYPIELLQ